MKIQESGGKETYPNKISHNEKSKPKRKEKRKV